MQRVTLDIKAVGSGLRLGMPRNHIFTPRVPENSLLSAPSPLCLLNEVPRALQSRCAFEKQLLWLLHSTPWLPSREIRAEKRQCTTSAWCERRSACARMALLASWVPRPIALSKRPSWAHTLGLQSILKMTVLCVLNLVPVLLRDIFTGTFSLSHPQDVQLCCSCGCRNSFRNAAALRKHLPCFPFTPKREKSYANTSSIK